MARRLKNIKLHEVSLVDVAANKKGFLFFKQEGKAKPTPKKLKKKIKIVIDSDGTIGGTKIAVNGDTLQNLRDFDFHFWNNDDISRAVSCSYSKFVETEDGFSRSETFYLSKGDSIMNPKIKEQLEAFFGEDVEVDFEKAEENDAIVKAIETLNEYREDMPDDLKKAAGVVAKQAGLYQPVSKSDDDDKGNKDDDKGDLEKAGAKLSKDTLKKITDALAALKAILPQLAEDTKKSDVEKQVKELEEKIKEFEKKAIEKKDGDDKDGFTKILDELKKRLETVEKSAGVKKGIDGQGDDDDDEGNKNKTEDPWPSIPV